MHLYHVGFNVIEKPDLLRGRKNADFGQGFYLSNDLDFSNKWARESSDADSILNHYEIDLNGLNVKEFKRDNEWFNYIFKNRNGFEDIYKDYDVIIGPIANDTIFDTWGIITSGYVSEKRALKALINGPEYIQIAIKTNKALEKLKFIKSEIMDKKIINSYRDEVLKEQEEYQQIVLQILGRKIRKMLG